jgi:hypothetical protein
VSGCRKKIARNHGKGQPGLPIVMAPNTTFNIALRSARHRENAIRGALEEGDFEKHFYDNFQENVQEDHKVLDGAR